MGGKKKSPPKPKGFKGSDIYRGDQLVSRTYQTKGGTTVNKYYESPQEKQQRMFAESRLGQLAPMLGQDPAADSPYGIQRQNYVDSKKSLFDREYNKTLDTLRENVTSRFGTTQNSFYTDALGDMERDVKMPAYLEMQRGADDYIRANQVQEINALMALLGRTQDAYGGGINQGNLAAQMGNNFNMSRYQQQLAGYAATPKQTPWWQTALGTIGSFAP